VQKISVQNIVSNADKARKLREQILKTHKNFDEIKKSTESVMVKSSLSTQDDIKAEAQERMNNHNKNASEAGQGAANLIELNGETCLQHEIEPSDSLPRLSLMFNVSERDIKNKNALFGD